MDNLKNIYRPYNEDDDDITVINTGNSESSSDGGEDNFPEPEKHDISEYADHHALKAKNKGCSQKLLGNVCVVAFLVDEERSAWKPDEVDEMEEILESAINNIKKQSGLTDNRLSISYAFDVVPVQLKFDRNLDHQVVECVMDSYGYSDTSSYQKHYEKKFSKDEAPIVFVLSKSFRSFAVIDRSEEENTDSDEWSFVSYTGDKASCERTFIHELLHQFGAIDYYYPEAYSKAAEKILPNSIMNSGTEIDSLTRYIIGWDEEPDEKALQFLEETKDVTEEEIAKARKKEEDNDW